MATRSVQKSRAPKAHSAKPTLAELAATAVQRGFASGFNEYMHKAGALCPHGKLNQSVETFLCAHRRENEGRALAWVKSSGGAA
jgi:hypothetical protein